MCWLCAACHSKMCCTWCWGKPYINLSCRATGALCRTVCMAHEYSSAITLEVKRIVLFGRKFILLAKIYTRNRVVLVVLYGGYCLYCTLQLSKAGGKTFSYLFLLSSDANKKFRQFIDTFFLHKMGTHFFLFDEYDWIVPNLFESPV